ncbi:MAG: phage holin family protein [Myxococcaceae bacterium]
MPTSQLFRHVLEEARELAKAEVAQAKEELKLEARSAAVGGGLLGGAAGLILSAVTVFLVALGESLPFPGKLGLIVVAAAALVLAAVLALVGYRKLPLQPMSRTQESIKRDLAITRGTLS